MTSTQVKGVTAKSATVSAVGAQIKFEDRVLKLAHPTHVLIKIHACGVCHSDSFPFTGGFPGIPYPIVPGHEIVGVVEQVGSEVQRVKPGDRVGIGWHGGHCGHCESCFRGDYLMCQSASIPGINRDGGYAEYAVFPESVCALVPKEISSAEAAPMMCAGVTTFNALRHTGAVAGDLVAVLGLGGLGHLGVQFANKMGFRTVAIARGDDKAEFARKLGAHHYINSQKQNVAEELQKLGGAKVVLSTITNSDAMTAVIDGLGVDGELVVVGADMEPVKATPIQLIMRRRSVRGWASGTAADSQDCMQFAAQTGVRPMIEKFPLSKAPEAYERMMSGKARFRVVIEAATP